MASEMGEVRVERAGLSAQQEGVKNVDRRSKV